MTKTCFETERLRVRHFVPADLDDFAALCADPVVMRYMGDGSILERAEVARWIGVCQRKYAERGYGTSAVVERETGAFVGFCGVVRGPKSDFDEIIYALGQPYWGKGNATEVAREMLDYVFGISALDEIYATISAENAVSLRIMDKLGFTFVRDKPEDDGSVTKVYVRRR